MARNWTNEAASLLIATSPRRPRLGLFPPDRPRRRAHRARRPGALAGPSPPASRRAADWLACAAIARRLPRRDRGAVDSPCWATPLRLAALVRLRAGTTTTDPSASAWSAEGRGLARALAPRATRSATIPRSSAGPGSAAPTRGSSRRPWRSSPWRGTARIAHPRVAQGLAMIRDRAIRTGGWNLGNPLVFDTVMRPLPGPTGLALLALSGGRSEPRRTGRHAGGRVFENDPADDPRVVVVVVGPARAEGLGRVARGGRSSGSKRRTDRPSARVRTRWDWPS